MKHLFLPLFFLLCTLNHLYAQEASESGQRFITVTGSAEMSVAPDEIQLEFLLREYNNPLGRVQLEKIEEKFIKTLKKHGVKEKDILLKNGNFSWHYWWNYRRENYKYRSYYVQLSKGVDLMSLIQDLDMDGISSVNVAKSTHTRLQEFRKDVKIQAVKAAKEKADYLLESIGEAAGPVISIEEIEASSPGQSPYWFRQQNIMAGHTNTVMGLTSTPQSIDNTSAILLRYEIRAQFSIKS
jgi:hypothetical protein